MEYEQGSDQRFYATFVTYKGEAATVTGTPTITITHDWSGLVTDVNAQNMTLLAGTTYYYKWNIPVRADQTTYNVRYNATYTNDDATTTNVVGSEEFQVIKRKFYDKKGGGFVQRIVPKEWDIQEKERLFAILESLLNKDSGKIDIIKGIENLADRTKKNEYLLDSSVKTLSNLHKLDSNDEKLLLLANTLGENIKKIEEKLEAKKEDLFFSEISLIKEELSFLKSELEDFKSAFADQVSKAEVAKLHD